MHDVYDVLLLLIEKLLPNGQEKHDLVAEVKNLQAQDSAATAKTVEKKAGSSKDGSSKQ